ncbi:uncharacterized protein LOC108954269 [Eucalyptus grandis]|uniref:uncharacterized protein LOC108954269 n=1 Tax=Eucalyptus grandis TaxID=71139 RepID=UPI00192EF081|nr:uncharacterized protein LOC108954269 [Eucalyptus grandis]
MAEAVLFSLATAILRSLATEMAKPGGSLASRKIQLCYAKDELQSLDDTVQTIQALLLDTERQQWHNHQINIWLKNLRDVLYDVQDLLDDVATEDLKKSWELFKKMAFGDAETSSDLGLEEIGQDIVKKCAGVPLAIYRDLPSGEGNMFRGIDRSSS